MKTLKERQADRARRKEENAQVGDNTGNDRIGNVLALMAPAQAALESLSEEERAELSARLSNGGEPTDGYRDRETFPLAGIGVTNPLVVEMTGGAANFVPGEQTGNGGGSEPGSPGAALAAAQAQAAWGTGAPADAAPPVEGQGGEGDNEAADETLNEDGSNKTKAQLQEILNSRSVKFESDANHAALVALVKANPAPATQA